MSRSLQANNLVSRVTTMALYPAFSALLIMLLVKSSFLPQYNWNQCGFPALAVPISSIVLEDTVLTICGTCKLPAALATATSASGCAIDKTPTGASNIGEGNCVPNNSIAILLSDTSPIMRGTICQ